MATPTLKPDPPVRADRRCAHCRGPRLDRLPKVITQRSRAELIENLEKDAFCTAVCCRAYHQVDIADQPDKVNRLTERAWAHEPGWQPA